MHWYTLRSKPNKELTLWQELCARDVECFYPHLRVHPVNSRSRPLRPYFPGYLFLRADIESIGTSAFQWIPFSLGLVSFGGEPASVPDHLVHAIQRHIDGINAAGGEQHFNELKKGEAIVIQGGPFKGYSAIFDTRLSGSERVRVFLQLLEVRQMKLELSAKQVQRQNQY